ncbi:hypothetical protein [Lysobacter fragariae]
MSWKTWCLLLGVLVGLGFWVRTPAAPERVDHSVTSRAEASWAVDDRVGRLDEGRARQADEARRIPSARRVARGRRPLPRSAVADSSAFRFERFIVSPVEVDWAPGQVEVGDVTGDGRLDIVVAMNSSGFQTSA